MLITGVAGVAAIVCYMFRFSFCPQVETCEPSEQWSLLLVHLCSHLLFVLSLLMLLSSYRAGAQAPYIFLGSHNMILCSASHLSSNLCLQTTVLKAGAIGDLVRLIGPAQVDDLYTTRGALYKSVLCSGVSLSSHLCVQAAIMKAGAIPALIQLLEVAQPDGRYAAAAALYNLAGQEGKVRLAIVTCKAVPPLVQMLQAESWSVRHAPLHTLATVFTFLLALGCLHVVWTVCRQVTLCAGDCLCCLFAHSLPWRYQFSWQLQHDKCHAAHKPSAYMTDRFVSMQF